MDRRRFIVSGGATAIVATGMPSVSEGATAREWARLLRALRKAKSDLDKASDWIAWGHEATLAIGAKEAPPPSPASPEAFYHMLLDQRASIENVTLPDFGEDLPETAPVSTVSLDTVRSDIRRRVMAVQACVAEVQEARRTVDYYDIILLALQDQEERLRRLQDIVEGLYTKLSEYTPGFITGLIQQYLAFGIIDLESSYIPTVVETTSIARARRDLASARVKSRIGLLSSSANDILQLLVVEKVDLQIEYDRLEALDIEVANLANKAQEARQAETDENRALYLSKAYRQAAEADLQDAEDEQADAEQRVRTASSHIQTARNEYNEPYVCPVSKANWQDCQEPTHVEYKSAYQKRRQASKDRLDALGEDLSRYKGQVDNAKNTAAARQQDLRSADQDVSAKINALTKARTAREAAVQKHAELSEFARQEKWRSRADLYWAENGSDKATLDAAVTQLGRI